METGSRRERELRAGLLAQTGDLWRELCLNGRRSLGADPGATVTIDTEHVDLLGVEPEDLQRALVTSASAAAVTAAAR